MAVSIAVFASGCGGDTVKTTAQGTANKTATVTEHAAPTVSRATSGDRSVSLRADDVGQRVETDEHHSTIKLATRTIVIDFDKATIAGVDGDPISISKTAKKVEVESIKGALKITVDGTVVYLKP